MAKKLSDEEILKLASKKKYSEALEAAYTACMYDFENRTLHKNLFLTRNLDLLSKESEYQDEAFKRFIEKNKSFNRLKEALSHYKLGLIYENGKKFKDAGKEYGEALKIIPEFAPALLRRGMVYEIRTAIKRAIKGEFLMPLGALLARTIEDYTKAGQVDPDFPLAFYCLALHLKGQKTLLGDYTDQDLWNYFKCVALDPDCAAAHNNIGLIYVDRRDFENAEKEFSEMLRIFPGHPTGVRNLEGAKKKKRRGYI